MANAYHTSTTTNKFIRKATDAVMRQFKYLSMLKAKGRISLNTSGENVQIPILYREQTIQDFGIGDTVNFQKNNVYKNIKVDQRAYIVSDMIHKGDKLKNDGSEAIIKLWSGKVTQLMKVIQNQFCPLLINTDGFAAGNSKQICGLASATGCTGSAGTSSRILSPSDTYFSQSTALGAVASTWTGTWPDGTGPTHYDWYSPTIVDVTSTAWQATTKTWPNTCLEALSWGILYGGKNGSNYDIGLLSRDYLHGVKEAYRTYQRVNITRPGSESLLVRMGFSDVINHDGVDLTTEYGVKASRAYILDSSKVSLYSWQPQLFASEQDFDLDNVADRVLVDCYANQFAEPRHLLTLRGETAI